MYIELLYFVLMLVGFVVCSTILKLPSSISFAVASVIGGLVGGFGLPLRHLVEGTFGYLDTVLVIATSMVFMKAIEAAGTFDLVSVFLVEKLHKFPTLLLIAFSVVIMFPAMVTGSSISSVISAGGLIGPIMTSIGISKERASAIIGVNSFLGMIAPPVNIPVMFICEAVDMAYTNFTLMLVLMTFPMAIISTLIIGRKEVGKIDIEAVRTAGNFDQIKENVKWPVYLPLLALVIVILIPNVFPKSPTIGLPLTFLVAAVPAFFVGRKVSFVKVMREAIEKSIGIMGMLMGVGMFVQIITLIGSRGFIVYITMILPEVVRYIAMCTIMPAFGGISVFGSASVLGGPLTLAFNKFGLDVKICAAAISLICCVGDVLPPTAACGLVSANLMGCENYFKGVLKYYIIPIVMCIAYGLLWVLVVAPNKALSSALQ